MKKMLYLIFFIPVLCFSQEDQEQHEDIALFNKGYAIFEVIDDLYLDNRIKSADTTTWQEKRFKYDLKEMREELLKKSIQYFEELIQKYPNSKLYCNTIFNKAGILKILEEDDEAKVLYLEIVSKPDTTQIRYHKLRNLSLKILAEIELNEDHYSLALEYINNIKNKSAKELPKTYQKYEETELARLYGKAYFGLKDEKKALEFLLPTIFEYKLGDESVSLEIDGSEQNVQLAASIIKHIYTPEKARKLFEKAAQKIFYDKKGNYYYIKFLNTKIEAYSGIDYELLNGSQKEIVAKNIENSLFKKLLNE